MASAREALALMQQDLSIDLAILDMQMPDMDGLTLAGELRRCRDIQSLPMILLTPVGHRNARTEAVDFVACIPKPVKMSQLYHILAST